jgi:tetratricopeptide (TPR) repeat protein
MIRRDVALGAILVLVTAAVYLPTAWHRFGSLDDVDYITSNQIVQHGLTWDGLGWAFTTTTHANWHPLTWLSHMVDCQLFGPWAGGHHLMSLALHLAAAVLLFTVLRRMTRQVWPSAMVAALFALHPLHVESVAWASERKDVLSTLFWMLTLVAYVRYVERPGTLRYAAVLVLLALGLMAKPMLVTLPLVLLLLDFWPLGRTGWSSAAVLPAADEKGRAARSSPKQARGRPREGPTPLPLVRRSIGGLVLEKVPLFILVIASSIVTFIVQQAGEAVVSVEQLSPGARAAHAAISYVAYLGKTFWPADLAGFYPYAATAPLHVAFATAGLAVLTGLAVWAARKRPWLTVGWGWYVITLVPVIGLVQVGTQAMADRYTYVPLIGIFIAAVWGVWNLLAGRAWRPRVLAPVAAGVLVACGGVTSLQLRTWADGLTFYERVVQVSPDNAEMRTKYAAELRKAGRYDDAEREDRAAVALAPDFAQAHNDLAMCLGYMHKYDDAITEFQEAVRLDPESGEAWYNLAATLELVHRDAEAVDAFHHLAGKKWGGEEGRLRLAAVLARLGDFAGSVTTYRGILADDPGNVRAMGGLAWIMATAPDEKLRDGPEAVRLAGRACDLTHRQNPIHLRTLAAAYAQSGQFAAAADAAQQSLDLVATTGPAGLVDDLRAAVQSYRQGLVPPGPRQSPETPPAAPVRR